MKRTAVGARLLASALALSPAVAFSQEKPGAAKPPQMTPQQQAQMEAFEKARAVTQNHKRLEYSLGEWTASTKMWMDPGQPPAEYTGGMSNKAIMDGRYVQSSFKGAVMGQPFEGMGLTGYDNVARRYVATWIDNFGTMIFYMTGAYDPGTKVFSYHSEMDDPMKPGSRVKVRETVKIVNADKHVMEWYETHADGKEAKTMEITYTRKK